MRNLWAVLGLTLTLWSAEEDKRRVNITFRALAYDTPLAGAGFVGGERFQRLNISHEGLSDLQRYSGDPTLTFVIAEDLARKVLARPSQEMIAATQRLQRANATSAQAAQESAEITQIIRKLQLTHSEKKSSVSAGDQAEVTALELRLAELATILAAAAQESELASLQILQLQATKRHLAPPDPAAGKVQKAKKVGPGILTPTASYTFPSDGNYLLLFFRSGNGHQIIAIPDDHQFPFGSIMMLNLTGVDLTINQDDHRRFPLGTGSRILLQAEPGTHALEIEARTPEGWTPAYALRSLFHKDVRTICFVTRPDPESHAVSIRGIEHRRPPAKEGK